MAEGGLPREVGNSPTPQPIKMDETFGVVPVYAGSQNYSYIAGMDNTGPCPQWQFVYPGDMAPEGPVEVDGGHY